MNLKHGKCGSRVYKTWQHMKERCYNPNCKDYKNYGGRGINICGRWRSFELFLYDMGEPEVGMSIDRIDNDGDYELSNCRWATREEQNNNTRANEVMKTLNKGYFATFEEAQEFYMKHQAYITLVNVGINDNAHIYGEYILYYITDGEVSGTA